MTRWPLVLAALPLAAALAAACGDDDSGDDGPGDGSDSDAAVSGVDAGVTDDCPNRTAAQGEPETELPARAILDGDFTGSDLAGLSGIRMVNGSVRLEGSAGAVELADLEVITGDLVITADPDALTSIRLPALQTVGGSVQIDAPGLASLDAPALESTGGVAAAAADVDLHCLVSGSVALGGHAGAALDLGKLRTAGVVKLDGMAALASLELPALEQGSLIVSDAPALASIALPALTGTPAQLRLLGCGALTDLSLGAITSIGAVQVADAASLADLGAFDAIQDADSLAIENDDALTALGFPALVTVRGALDLRDNSALAEIGLGALTEIGEDSAITDNPLLPTCDVQGLRDRVRENGSLAAFLIHDNADDDCR